MRLVTAFPFAILIISGLSWARWGIDIPYWDDWRTINTDLGSFSLGDLFKPANDTMSPVGKFLDSLLSIYISYNVVLYQFITMVIIIGSIFVLSLHILNKSYKNVYLIPFCFLFSIFISQPGSYWGLQVIAYYQAIPILTLLLSISITISLRFNSLIHISAIALLGIIGGFSYISGAFAALAAAVVSLVCATRGASISSRRLWQAGIGYTIAATITVSAQSWVVLIDQGGAIHVTGTPWTLPWESEFWAFMFGMMARSVRFPFLPSWPLLSLSVGVAIFTAILLAAFLAFKTILLSLDKEHSAEGKLAYVYLCLAGAIGLYTFMVVASRAALGGSATNGWSEYFIRGGLRFHFFWVSVLLPFVVAMLAQKLMPQAYQKGPIPLIFSIITILYASLVGTFSHDKYFKDIADTIQRPGLSCIHHNLINKGPIICKTLYPADLSNAIMKAREKDFSFTRYLLFPEYNIDTSLIGSAGGDIKDKGIHSLVMKGGFDPQIYFAISKSSLDNFNKCQEFTLKGKVESQNSDIIQLFFLNKDDESYSETSSRTLSYEGGSARNFEFTVENRKGFSPNFRLDPGGAAQIYRVTDLSLACR